MANLSLGTSGLSAKEVKELTAELRTIDEIESAEYLPDIIGTMQHRSGVQTVQMGLQEFRIVLRLAHGAALGVGLAAANHLYRRVGEALVDKTLVWLKARFTNKSVVEVEVTLFGPDGKPVKKSSYNR